MSFIRIRKMFIAFRRNIILPIKYFFNEAEDVKRITVRDSAEIMERMNALKKSLIMAKKRDQYSDKKILEGKIEELAWMIYADS